MGLAVAGNVSTSFGSSAGALYWIVRLGTGFGRRSPRWQVLHVMTRAAELSLLMAFIMRSVRLAVCFSGVSVAYASHPAPFRSHDSARS
jgi:hypothetical protein